MASAKKRKKTNTQPSSPEQSPSSATSQRSEEKSQFEKWTPVKVHRSQIKNAPYNPRTISDDARKKLRDNLSRVGLIEPPAWNVRTGNLVGGHQRMAAMDDLHGTADYFITVAQVDLDEKTEKEQNIFLNNPNAQGDWDLEKLAELYRVDGLDSIATGFDMGELYQLFGDSPFAQAPEELEALGESVRKAREQYLGLVNRKVATDDVDFYGVVVFESNDVRAEFSKELGLTDNKFFDGKRILEIVREWRAKKTELAANGGTVKSASPSDHIPEGTGEPG